MAQASTDDVRLSLLDRASTHRVGLRQYVDDQRIKVASRGQVAHAIVAAQRAADSAKSLLVRGPGKTEACLSTRGSDEPVKGTTLVPERKVLGFMMPPGALGEAHKAQMETKLLRRITQDVAEMETLGLSYATLHRRILRRTLSSALYGMSLVVHTSGYDAWADHLHDTALRRLLGLTRPTARAVLLQEHGCQLRLSCVGWLDAISLWARVSTYAQHEIGMPRT